MFSYFNSNEPKSTPKTRKLLGKFLQAILFGEGGEVSVFYVSKDLTPSPISPQILPINFSVESDRINEGLRSLGFTCSF